MSKIILVLASIFCGCASASLFTGAPFKEKTADDPQQELHWLRAGCFVQWGGK